jgi:hypothetical protein
MCRCNQASKASALECERTRLHDARRRRVPLSSSFAIPSSADGVQYKPRVMLVMVVVMYLRCKAHNSNDVKSGKAIASKLYFSPHIVASDFGAEKMHRLIVLLQKDRYYQVEHHTIHMW